MTNAQPVDAPSSAEGLSPLVHRVAAAADGGPPQLLNPTFEIVLATLFLVVVIGIHGVCLGRISKFFSTGFAHLTMTSPRWKPVLLTGVAIALIVLVHIAETHIWAGILYALGLVQGYGDSYFYVLEAYTTLGEGPNYMPVGYRLISPVIALTGLFTFGWSGSVLVYIVGQTGNLHAERSKAEAGASKGPETGA